MWNERQTQKENRVIRTVAVLTRRIRFSDVVNHQCIRERRREFNFGEHVICIDWDNHTLVEQV